jgi:hypothetical protein
MGAKTPDKFHAELNAIRNGPQSRATTVVVSMLGCIMMKEHDWKAPFHSGYKWEPGTHGLESCPGRAAYVIEQLTGTEITPKIGPKFVPDDWLDQNQPFVVLRRNAKARQEETFKSAEAAVAKHMAKYHTGPDVIHPKAADVKDRVRAMFDQDVERVGWNPPFHQSLTKLFAEWDPLGQKFDDLRDLIGPKFEKATAKWPGPGKNERDEWYRVDEWNRDRGPNDGGLFFFLVAPDGAIKNVYYDATRAEFLGNGKGGPAMQGR